MLSSQFKGLSSFVVALFAMGVGIIGNAKTNVRLRTGVLVGAVPPCRHVFNMINDIHKMDRQGRRSLPISCNSTRGINDQIFGTNYTL
ncbi:hypothetical protein Desti_0978 [Desulfomonile tiedjei DSM 6799]|uniref:Uncharacterized protein n=1 Tax=Desulfomonile tiedjei (strain ATCC 49306 / DSM 6799 / DCB-1) TaxID=706587 RepID=I4C2A5_DESTA|nr:hypothetical protein Desti_0978 [Desulfomonile tiedjei DSM 6799]